MKKVIIGILCLFLALGFSADPVLAKGKAYRPQKKEQKRIQAMLASMEVGDTALTTSGFYGVIIDITDDDVIGEFGNNKNCRIPMQKAAIAQIEKPGAE